MITIQYVYKNLYRGAQPDDLADFKTTLIEYTGAMPPYIFGRSLYINVIINLMNDIERDYLGKSKKSDKQNPADYNLERHFIECDDITPPSPSQIDEFFRLVQQAYDQHKNVYVHCLHGVDRTGFMCAAYRIKICGWSFLKACREWLGFGWHWYVYWSWAIALYRWKRGLKQ